LKKTIKIVSERIPVRIESEANLRECWRRKHARAKVQREATRLILMMPCSRLRHTRRRTYVTLTRIAPRKLDGDNLQRGFKAVRDGVADALGINDGADHVGWHYTQDRGKPKEYAALVEIEVETD
jgi:hypothetical protein